MKCMTCGKDLGKEVWAFATTGKIAEYDFCSEECANKKMKELESNGYRIVGQIVNGN